MTSKNDNNVLNYIHNSELKSNPKDIIKLTLDNYCVNYDDVENYSVNITKSTISKYLYSDIAFKYKKAKVRNNGSKKELILFSPKITVIKDKVKVSSYGHKTIFFDKELFFKSLWVVKLKKEIKREYNFSGDRAVTYNIYHFFIDDTGKKVYIHRHSDYKIIEIPSKYYNYSLFMPYRDNSYIGSPQYSCIESKDK